MKVSELERVRADLMTSNKAKEQLQRKLKDSQEKVRKKVGELERARAELRRENAANKLLQREYERVVATAVDQHEVDEHSPNSLVEPSRDLALRQAVPEELRLPSQLTWQIGKPAPDRMSASWGSAAGNTAYFSSGVDLYSYTVPGDKWTKLPECKYQNFSLAIVEGQLTTIGGRNEPWVITNSLLSLSGNLWEEVLPPMLTKRVSPAAVKTPAHLVVAGGRRKKLGGILATVEILNIETLQWSAASSLPETVLYPQMVACDGCFYISNDKGNVFSCSEEDLLESTNCSDGGSVWTRLASIPTPQYSSLTTHRGQVLAIGGEDGDDNPTGAIHCYDKATNSWSTIGEVPTPRYNVLTAVLPSDKLVVVGGVMAGSYCSLIEIGRYK